MKEHIRKIVTFILIAAFAYSVVNFSHFHGFNPVSIKKGDTFPDFQLKDIVSGKIFTKNEISGSEKTVIVFWSPSCSVCMRELQFLSSHYYLLKKKGINVVSVAYLESSEEIIKNITANFKVKFPVLIDNGSLFDELSVSTVPFNVILDKNLKVLTTQTGFLNTNLLF